MPLREGLEKMDLTVNMNLREAASLFEWYSKDLAEISAKAQILLDEETAAFNRKKKAVQSIVLEAEKEAWNILLLKSQFDLDLNRLSSLKSSEAEYFAVSEDLRIRFENLCRRYGKHGEMTQAYLDVMNIVAIKGYGLQFSLRPLTSWNNALLELATPLLNEERKRQINEWLGNNSMKELLYRGSRDGFEASEFHSRCDCQGATIAIIRSTNGSVFGGFSTTSWNSSGTYSNSEGSWLFTFHNGAAKFDSKPGSTKHLFHNPAGGPVFGENHDLYVADYCNTKMDSYSNIVHSYDFQGRFGKESLSGGYKFQVHEIEVYRVDLEKALWSSILSGPQANQVMLWFKPYGKSSCNLLYRGSLHGFQASTFHRLCDDKGATLTVVRSTSNHTFGGYTSLPWDSTSGWVTDNDSWIFTLTHNGPAQFKAKRGDPNHVYRGEKYGPVFGSGHDLKISDGCNTQRNNYCIGNKSFDVQERAGPYFLCDPCYFQVAEIEVFQVI
jgi:hypothetical protein